MYRILFLDIDGTLVNSEKQITPRTKQALYQAREQGLLLAIASGRPEPGVRPSAAALELETYGGYLLPFNGGIIKDAKTGAILHATRLSEDAFQLAYQLSKEHGIPMITYQGGQILSEVPASENSYLELESRINRMPVAVVSSIPDALETCPVKCLMLAPPEQLAPLEPIMREALGTQADVFRSEPFFLEVMPKGIDKAASIAHLIEVLGIRQEETIAAGDGYNDVSMIAYAGLGVAMANGCDAAKAAANYITTADNDHDGLAEMLERFVL